MTADRKITLKETFHIQFIFIHHTFNFTSYSSYIFPVFMKLLHLKQTIKDINDDSPMTHHHLQDLPQNSISAKVSEKVKKEPLRPQSSLLKLNDKQQIMNNQSNYSLQISSTEDVFFCPISLNEQSRCVSERITTQLNTERQRDPPNTQLTTHTQFTLIINDIHTHLSELRHTTGKHKH